MKLHYISYPRSNPNITKSLKSACARRHIDFTYINPSTFDFTDKTLLPSAQDILYRAAVSTPGNNLARIVEQWLMHEQVATLYNSYARSICQFPQSHIVHEKNGLPVPKTVCHVPRDRRLLDKYVDYIGGFPVIIKATGGSHGVGVMKIDSKPSLYSVVDYLSAAGTQVIMRQFIQSRTSARLIVLGNKVVGSLEYVVPTGDFRSNVGNEPIVRPQTFPETINKLALESVSTMGYLYGGVDIIIDKDNNPYVAETNFPCNFYRAEKVCGIDISGQIVDYLISRANAL